MHTSKTRESSGQPGSLSHKRPVRSAAAGFQNIRSNHLALQRIQDTANSHRSLQLKIPEISKPQHEGAAVIQRKPLSADVLNVAGEQHDESDEQRIWERELPMALFNAIMPA